MLVSSGGLGWTSIVCQGSKYIFFLIFFYWYIEMKIGNNLGAASNIFVFFILFQFLFKEIAKIQEVQPLPLEGFYDFSRDLWASLENWGDVDEEGVPSEVRLRSFVLNRIIEGCCREAQKVRYKARIFHWLITHWISPRRL